MSEIEAFILIQTKVGSERNVYGRLADLEEIERVYELFGEWDIIARIKVDNVGQLDGFVSETVRNIEGVNLTSTMIISR